MLVDYCTSGTVNYGKKLSLSLSFFIFRNHVFLLVLVNFYVCNLHLFNFVAYIRNNCFAIAYQTGQKERSNHS